MSRFTAMLAAAAPDEDGFIAVALPGLIECRIGAKSQARAVALADALIETALTFDFTLSDEDGLTFDDERTALRIYETRATPQRSPSGRFCIELFDPRSFQWTRRNLIGHWHDLNGRPVEQAVRNAVAAAVNAAPLIKRVRDAANVAEKREQEQAAATRVAQAQQNRKRLEMNFLRDKARVLAELTELKTLAAAFGTGDAYRRHHRTAAMMDRLAAAIAALEAQLAPDKLATELDEQKLFGD